MNDGGNLIPYLKASYFLSDQLDFLCSDSVDLDFLNKQIDVKDFMILKRDFNFLFPYKKKKKIHFDLVFKKDKTFYLVDDFSFEKEANPLSDFLIEDYVSALKKEFLKEKLLVDLEDKLILDFHLIVEKLVLVEFLRQESVLSSYNFEYAIGYNREKGQTALFSSIILIFKKVIKNTVEKSGLLETNYNRVLHQITYN